MAEKSQSPATRGVSTQFGYYPLAYEVETAQFSVQTLPEFAGAVALVQGDPDITNDWIYLGAQRSRDFMTGEVSDMPYSGPRIRTIDVWFESASWRAEGGSKAGLLKPFLGCIRTASAFISPSKPACSVIDEYWR